MIKLCRQDKELHGGSYKKRCMMDYREKDERNICCALCSESGRSPEYGPEIHRFRNGRGDAEVDSYKVFPGIELNIYSVHMDIFF